MQDKDLTPEKGATTIIEEDPEDKGLILERYKVLEELASTRFSTVYKAFDSKMQRLVAIKMIDNSSKATTWAKREAHLSAQLNNPNICTIYEYEETDEGHFLIMEYLEGLTLRDVLDYCKTLSLDEALTIGKEISLALESAHINDIIHKDIKPENVMLLQEGRIKIMDFGTGRLLGHAKEAQKTLIGTPSYMSPEQVNKERLDDRTDQFSLAVVLYEMIAGHTPFEGKTTRTTILKVQNSRAQRLDKIDDEVNEKLAEVINKALSKKADERYDSVIDFRYKLERAHPTSSSADEVVSSLVERCTDTFERPKKEKTATIYGLATDFVGRIYVTNYRILKRVLATTLIAGSGYLLFTTIGQSYSLIVMAALAGLALFFQAIGLLALGSIASIALGLAGYILPALILFGFSLVWFWFFKKKNKFDIAFSLIAPILALVNLQVLFPIFTGLAFTPARAAFVLVLGAFETLIFTAVWQQSPGLFSDVMSLSQLIIWPVAGVFISALMRKKTLARAVVAVSASFVFLLGAYVVIGAVKNESFELALQSASLSLIITMLVLPLIPYDYLESEKS